MTHGGGGERNGGGGHTISHEQRMILTFAGPVGQSRTNAGRLVGVEPLTRLAGKDSRPFAVEIKLEQACLERQAGWDNIGLGLQQAGANLP